MPRAEKTLIVASFAVIVRILVDLHYWFHPWTNLGVMVVSHHLEGFAENLQFVTFDQVFGIFVNFVVIVVGFVVSFVV